MDLSAFFSYVVVTTYTPGPNNIMAMRNGNRYGFRGALPFMLGMGSGAFIIMLASCLFNVLLSELVPLFLPFMRWVGVAYMLYLAWGTLRPHNPKKGGSLSEGNSYLAGLLLQSVNVKVILYALTVTATFIIPYTRAWPHLVLFSAFLALMGFSSLVLWALFGVFLDRWMGAHQKAFAVVMALLLVYSAVAISGLI